MTATKTTSRVGQGMKPRGKQQEAHPEKPTDPMKTGESRCNCWCNGDPYKAPEQHAVECPESLESRQREESASTDQVQPEGAGEGENQPASEPETPPSQEAKTAEKDEERSRLLKMLAESPEKTEEGSKVQRPNLEPAAVIKAIEKDEIERHERVRAPNLEGEVLRPDEVAVAVLRKGDGSGYTVGIDPENAMVNVVGLGLRPNGDFGVVIVIPEYFVTSVRDFAEADGQKSVSQWCSEFFNMNLEAYCTPNKGR